MIYHIWCYIISGETSQDSEMVMLAFTSSQLPRSFQCCTFSISPATSFFYSLRSEGRRPERSEVNKFVVPRELSRANSSEKYIYIHIIHITDWEFTLLLSVCESENPFWEKAIKRLSPPKRPLCATRRLGRGERKRAKENGKGKENTPSAPARSPIFFSFPFGIPAETHAVERD